MRLWKGIVEVTQTKRYHCTVKANDRREARLRLESGMDGTETTYPCGCGCNRDSSSEIREAHSIQLIPKVTLS